MGTTPPAPERARVVTPPSGTVVLQHVPPGDYVVGLWHEKLGVQEQRVTLPPSGSLTVRVTAEIEPG